MARQLQKLGIERVRPLQGGFQAWKGLGYPLQQPAEVAWHTAAEREIEAKAADSSD